MQTLDAVHIEDVIGTGRLCADCIMLKTRMQRQRLNAALPRLIGALRVASAAGDCTHCLKQVVTHRLTDWGATRGV